MQGAKYKWLCLIAFVIAWMVHGVAVAQTSAELEAQLKAEQAALDSLKARMAAEEVRLKKTQQKHRSEAAQLNQLERDIYQAKNVLRTVQRETRELSSKLNTTERNLRRFEARLKDREAGMATRAREMYKVGRRGTMEVLFSATSFGDAARRVRYLSRVAEQDQQDFKALQEARKRVSGIYAIHSSQHRKQQILLQSKLKNEQYLKRQAADKSRVVKQLVNDQSKLQRELKNLENQKAESDARVAEAIRRIQETQRRGKRLAKLLPFDFIGHKGSLLWPVSGQVVARFGRQQDAELKTWTFNRGINIAAPEDTPVQAVAPGEVVMVDWFPGYGRFVLLRHPGEYFTLYGHLNADQVQTGEILAEGTTVGTVGSTGRLDGEPQLHFEVMNGEDPEDPLGWLKR